MAFGGSYCMLCIAHDWFGNPKEPLLKCTMCETRGCKSECKLIQILENNNECPICLDPLDENARVQLCDIHRVCSACTYDTNRGCPICRVGQML